MVHELRARVLFVRLEGFELPGPRRLPARADERGPRRDACGGRCPRAERPPLARPCAGEGRFLLRRAAAEAPARARRCAAGEGPWPVVPGCPPLPGPRAG